MARPPSEWPIPIYDLELRERLLVSFSIPASVMLHHVPAPLTPVVIGGRALCSVTFASGRVLKRAGSTLDLASEFHLLEAQTPVAWSRACCPTERGLFTLQASSDHAGLNRLLSRCATKTGSVPARPGGRRAKVQLFDDFQWWVSGGGLRIATGEVDWPTQSVIDSPERAEALLAHPTYRFFAEPERNGVRAVPVRDYARSTRPTEATDAPTEWLADLLQIPAEALIIDHALLQKRVTQTVFFPSERLNSMPRGGVVAHKASAEAGAVGLWEPSTGRLGRSVTPRTVGEGLGVRPARGT